VAFVGQNAAFMILDKLCECKSSCGLLYFISALAAFILSLTVSMEKAKGKFVFTQNCVSLGNKNKQNNESEQN